MRSQFYNASLALLFTCMLAGSASAATVNMTFDTVSSSSGVPVINSDGSVYFNELSPASAPVPVSGAGQASVGNGSWQASGAGGFHTFTLYARNLGGGGVNEGVFTGFNSGTATIRIRDIESFSFDTNQPSGTSLTDWNIQLYTVPDTAGGFDSGFDSFQGPNGDDSNWYGRRMIFEPAYAHSFSGPKDTWNSWSTETGTNQFGMIDTNPGSGLFGPADTVGFTGGPTLADVQGGDIFWLPGSEGGTWPTSGLSKGPSGSSQALGVNYADELLWLVRFQIGNPNNHPMLLDNFSFKLKDTFDAGFDANLVAGQTVFIDFEDPNFVAEIAAVPEPGSLFLLGLGSLCLQAVRRKQRVG